MSQVNKVRGQYLASSLYSSWTVEHKEWVTFRVKNFLQTFFRWKEYSEEFRGCLPGAEGLSNRESFGMLGRYSLEHWRLRGNVILQSTGTLPDAFYPISLYIQLIFRCNCHHIQKDSTTRQVIYSLYIISKRLLPS